MFFPDFPRRGVQIFRAPTQQPDQQADLGLEQGMGGGLGQDDYRALALLQAIGPIQQSGLQRYGTPMGSIAGALGPLVAAPILARAAMAQQQSAQQAAQLEQLKAMVDMQYKGALTQKALAPDASQDPYKGLPGGIRARLSTDPNVQAAVEADQAAKDQRAQVGSQLILDRSQQLAQANEERKIRQDRAKPVDGRGGVYVYTPQGERQVGATQGDIEDQGLVPLTRQDSDALSSALIAAKQLGELRALSKKLLPTYQSGIMNRAMTLGSNLAKEAAGNPDVKKFRALSNFENLPEIRALNRGSRIPLAEVRALAKPSDLLDSQESAMEKTDMMVDMLRGVVSTMKLDPTILDKAVSEGETGASPGPTAKSSVEVDMDKQALGRAYMELKAKYPKATDAELADLYRSQLMKQTGVQ